MYQVILLSCICLCVKASMNGRCRHMVRLRVCRLPVYPLGKIYNGALIFTEHKIKAS